MGAVDMSEAESMDPQETARAAAAAMLEGDLCTKDLGMEILSVGPGVATLAMTVREDMLNGHGTCHGGMIFTLADSCFAYACNSHDRNAVAVSCLIDFVAPARLGDVLTAVAREISLVGRNGLYDVAVSNQDGVEVAHFRGKCRIIKGSVTGK